MCDVARGQVEVWRLDGTHVGVIRPSAKVPQQVEILKYELSSESSESCGLVARQTTYRKESAESWWQT